MSVQYFCIFSSCVWHTVEPQSYGPHSYGILSQPDNDIEYIFVGKYYQNFYKMGTGHQF